MPAIPIITIFDRPNIQTEKCFGYTIVRKCKASKLYMNNEDSTMFIEDGGFLFQRFKDLDFNYKGDTNFNAKVLENFNTFRVKASGTIEITNQNFNLWFVLFDPDGNPVGFVRNNYGNGHVTLNNDHRADWFLDVEITFYRNEGGYNFIVSGYYTHSNDNHPRKLDVAQVPIMGEILNVTEPELYFDFRVVETSGCQIKDFSVDFVE